MKRNIVTKELTSEQEWTRRGYTISNHFVIKDTSDFKLNIRCRYCEKGILSISKPDPGTYTLPYFIDHLCKATRILDAFSFHSNLESYIVQYFDEK